MAAVGNPRSRALPVPPVAPECAGVSSIAASVALACDVWVTQFDGTDSIPTLSAWPAFADTAPAVWGPRPPTAPRCRPANCGVGYQVPLTPAVAPPGPNVNCCPMPQPKFPRPTPKYACRNCLASLYKPGVIPK